MKTKSTLIRRFRRASAMAAIALSLSSAASAQSFTGSFTTNSTTPCYTINILFNNFTLTKTCNGGGFTFNIGFNYAISFTQSATCAAQGTPFPSIVNFDGSFGCKTTSTSGNTGVYFNSLSPTSSPGWTSNTSGSGTSVTGAFNSTTSPTCAAATFADICNTATVNLEGGGFARTARTLTFNPPPSNNLPIKLGNFDGNIVNKEILLTWKTETEINNQLFTVERSSDGKEWEAIGTIAGAGTSTNARSYRFTDAKPLNGINYYRLKQTDFNGEYSYSYVLSIKQFSLSSDVSIYPNPAKDNKLQISGLVSTANWNISVANATAQMLYNSALTDATVTLPELTPGMYFVRLSNNLTNESKVFKYIKQ